MKKPILKATLSLGFVFLMGNAVNAQSPVVKDAYQAEKEANMAAFKSANTAVEKQRGPRMVPQVIVENPHTYSPAEQKIKVTRSEFNAMPAARQQVILNDSRFTIVENH